MSVARAGPPLAVLLLAAPVSAGLLGAALPAFGWLPALGGDRFSLGAFVQLSAMPGLAHSAMLSLAAGLITAGLSLGVVFLFAAGWAGTPMFAKIRHLVSPLLAVPHAAAAFGLAFLIAPSGLLMRAISPWLTGFSAPPDWLIVSDGLGLSMMAGLIVKEVPFLFLVMLAAMPHMPMNESRMLAASLGYGRIAGFLHCVWPPLYRQIRLPVFAVIAFASSVVDVAAILGPTTPPVLAVRLVEWMNDPDLSMRFMASAGALLQLGVTLLALVLWIGAEKISAIAARALCGSGRRLTRDRALRLAGAIGMALTGLAVFAGLGVLAIWSVAGLWQFPDLLPAFFTLDGWRTVLPRLAGPMVTTLASGAAAATIAFGVVLALLIEEDQTGRRRQWIDQLIYLPLIVPQIAFLFGLQWLAASAGWTGTFGALVLVHLVFVLPYLYLSLSDPWRSFDMRYEQAALGLGRSRLAVLWRVRLPMLLRPALTAFAVGFAVSAGLYLPTLLIGAGRLQTVTTEAVALASGGNRRIIGIHAFLQMALPALGFLVAVAVPGFVYRNRRGLRA